MLPSQRPSGRVRVDRGDFTGRHLMLRREHREPFVPQPRDAAGAEADPDLAARIFTERRRQIGRQSVRFGIQRASGRSPVPSARRVRRPRVRTTDRPCGSGTSGRSDRSRQGPLRPRRTGDGSGRSSASSVVKAGSRHRLRHRQQPPAIGAIEHGGLRSPQADRAGRHRATGAIGSGRHRACSRPSRRSPRSRRPRAFRRCRAPRRRQGRRRSCR